MTKKQQQVYNWLLSKPGYLKKGAVEVSFNQKFTNNITDVDIALKQARIDYKKLSVKSELVTPVIEKSVLKPRKIEIKKESSNILDKKRDVPGTYFISGCAHAPWHNKRMYDSVFNYLNREVDLQGLILAGDIVDLNSLSSHDKGKIPLKGVTLSWEYDEANKFLDQFDSLKIKGTKDYIYGNHEDRYKRITKDSEISKLGEALISPTLGLKLKERGYTVFEDWKNDAIQLGKHLDVCHGEFFNVHSAKKHIDTYRKSVLYFHTHRFQVYVEGLVGGWNMGFGGDINAPIFNFASRAMKNSWVNSSCLTTLDKDGFYHVEPLMFIDNKLIVNGRVY